MDRNTAKLYVAERPSPSLWLAMKAEHIEQVPWTGAPVGHDAPHIPMGHIASTRSGQPIFGPSRGHLSAATNVTPHRGFGTRTVSPSDATEHMNALNSNAAAHVSLHEKYQPQDHHDATAFHSKLAQQNIGTPRGTAHHSIAQAHQQAAAGMPTYIHRALWLHHTDSINKSVRLYLNTEKKS